MQMLSKLIQTPHGFFTKDETAESICQKLGAEKLVTLKQVHSNIAHYIAGDAQMDGDALVTDKPGIALGIITADCVPILFYDDAAKIIGAAHAGWKGARYGVIESALKLMRGKGAAGIVAAIGPCIHQKSYEVDSAFHNNFIQESKENHSFFMTGKMAGKYQFNLPGYVENKLKQNGIKNIEILNEDTLSQPAKFCSFRRSTLKGENSAGRQISAICLNP